MMTRKEAIEFMRCNLYNTESCDKEECNQNKAITIAIDALEKQIPKKPILNKNKINPLWVEEALLCPICNGYVGSSVVMIGDKFCDTCGQAISWEDVVIQRYSMPND